MKGGKNLEEWVDRLLALATSSSRDLGRTAADSWWILLGRVFSLVTALSQSGSQAIIIGKPIKVIHQIYQKLHWLL